MNIDIAILNEALVGATVPIPVSGTLAGHAAGEPFDRHVYAAIKELYPSETFRQYEYLNRLYTDHPEAVSSAQRHALIKEPAVAFLLNRGKTTTEQWTPASPFDEKQNDTADVLVVRNGFYNILDVKTSNIRKAGQPPNIISSYKLARMCALMLDARGFDTHDITYVGIGWELQQPNLVCSQVHIRQLLKSNPRNLYINWAAALQIQFYVKDLDQTFDDTIRNWCLSYLHHYVACTENRMRTMETTFVLPFRRYLE